MAGESAATFVNNASKKEVVEKIEDLDRKTSRLARVERSKKEIALATAAMGAEIAGSLMGGAGVGYMQANNWEEYVIPAAVALGTVCAMKRLEDPGNVYWQVGFASANGMSAALAAGYARDYFSDGPPKPMT
jgi:hypothetical protein